MTGRAARVSRRTLLTGGAGLAGLGIGAAAVGVGRELSDSGVAGPSADDTLPFHGRHQPGVTTPMQTHAQFVGVDLVDAADHGALRGVLAMWSQDAAKLTAGRPGFSDTEPELADSPARLSITVGLGPGAFASPALAARRPGWCAPLPAFSIDRLQERWGQSDLIVVVAADDPMTVSHAVRMMVAPVRRRARVKWVQQGFHHRRNLFGQIDGTVQPPESSFDDLLWSGDDGQPWMAGGTSLVVRRIAMHMNTWEALDRRGRELSVGRTLDSGAPLTGTRESDDPVFDATRGGVPVIPASSHIARAHRRSEREQFLRRPYSYDLPPGSPGSDPSDTSDSGLIFATYQRDPVTQFVPVQRRLAEHDALNEWTTPIGSAVYAILPGCEEGSHLGATLFEGVGGGA